ncbi:MAG: FAD-dependent oxidoreductase [Leptolyngbyaceae cyanobacterium]
MTAQQQKPVLILGGGFTGLFAAIHLRQQQKSLPIVLVDKNNRFIFKPLLYDFLSSEVQLDMAWPSYDELLSNRDITFVEDSVQDIDLIAQQVTLKSQLAYEYEYLVLALGGVTGYFGVAGAQGTHLAFAMPKMPLIWANICVNVCSRPVKSPQIISL